MQKFRKTQDKVENGTFDGTQIRKLMRDKSFVKLLKGAERTAWYRFKDVTDNFLGNNRAPDYADRINKMLESFKWIGCNISLKMHLLHAHLDRFPSNCGAYSDQQAEKTHQDVLPYEQRFHDHGINFAAEVCHGMNHDTETKHKRQSIKQRNKRARYQI